MQILGLRYVFWTVFLFVSIMVFLGSQNTAFASDIKEDNWIVGTTLSTPGIPHITSGENSLKPTWIWEASGSQIAGTIYYSVEWCQQANFSGCETNLMYTNSNSFSFDDSNLLTNGIWYMRVRAMDEFGHKSAYSPVGLGTLNYYSLVSPYNFTANLVRNEAKLSWYDCWATNFRVWGSGTGFAGSYKTLGETETYGFSSSLGTDPARWFYVTAVDKWGNESPPSPVIKVQIPGLKQADTGNLRQDLGAIFEPIWHGFSLRGGQVAGARTDANNVDESSDSLRDFIPLDYFGI